MPSDVVGQLGEDCVHGRETGRSDWGRWKEGGGPSAKVARGESGKRFWKDFQRGSLWNVFVSGKNCGDWDKMEEFGRYERRRGEGAGVPPDHTNIVQRLYWDIALELERQPELRK
jgi:hypothetical protein